MSSQTAPEWPTATSSQPIGHATPDVRFDFLREVYGLLLGGVAAFVALEVLLFTTGAAEAIASVVFGTSWLLILGGFMLMSWLATTVTHRAASRGQALAGYGLLVVAQAIIFVPLLWIARETAPEVLGQAAAVTLVGFVGLTVVGLTSARDFSFLGSVLRWVGIGALLLIVGAVLFGFQLGLLFSVGMVVFAGAAILYDTQTILRDYPEGTEVQAAMSLFSSVALLFWYVLRIFLATRD